MRNLLLGATLIVGAMTAAPVEAQSPKKSADVKNVEDAVKKQIEVVMKCDKGVVFYSSEAGAYRADDIEEKGDLIISKEVFCFTKKIEVCTSTLLQYHDGKMVNGFTTSGACVPTEIAKDLEKTPGVKTSPDLAERLKEKVVLEK